MAQYLTIYVQSRGISQEDDYRWLKVEDNSQIAENPHFLNRSILPNYPTSFVSLIDSHKFSLVLVRNQQHFILLVTGLISATTDFMGRNIRNSIVWIYPPTAEAQVRALTVAALTGELENAIASVILRKGDSDYGFTVDTQKLAQLTSTIGLDCHNNADLACRLGNNSAALRQEIALEIKANCLPPQEQLLVVVTTIKSAQDMEKLRVWRGLSNRIESQDLVATNQTSEKKTLIMTGVIATAAIIALTVFLIL
ncbi:hypothetical protein [Gloeocapsa sp. PCC 73106]|uniref:hypothetical protein n=1 Tax=Gloeocapsa sp. PCC 73106 TaxID=102232 RepID=UPI0002ACDEFF|nr:hypothetical protein [Gloeocapsa sp. PCC 73106]ELR96436.1 hypothetical protein GLO73106DRAFT_00002300 [Gloeocapsa sp. PCC 73106]